MKKNLFIALEGIDGSGKSSQAALLAERLKQEGHTVYSTFEPTDSYIGITIRNILKGNIKASHETIAGLFLADRLHHLLNEENGIVKKLAEGFTVITDRYYFSSYAYHGAHVDIDWVIDANSMCAKILRPDINVFIDVPPEICMQRISSRRAGTEIFETIDNLRKVYTKYMEAFSKLSNQERIVMIDGNRPPDVVTQDIADVVANIQGT